MKQLPKYFVIERNLGNPLWSKYIKWLNSTYKRRFDGSACYSCYGVDGDKAYISLTQESFPNGIELTLEQWDGIGNKPPLKEGDIVDLHGIRYRVIKSCADGNYFLNGIEERNERIFNELKLDREEFTKSILGYYIEGGFPYTKTLEDLQKLINALQNYRPKEMEKKITIPIDIFDEGQKAMNSEQLAYFRANVDPWTRETTEEFIKGYYKKHACTLWKSRIEKAFPFVISKEIDLSSGKIDGHKLFGNTPINIISIRSYGELCDKAFYLSPGYNWELKTDSLNATCLVPTRK